MEPGLYRPLTPDECAALSKSLGDLPSEYQLTPAEVEMLQEQLHGTPQHYGEPGRAAAAMKARLAYLIGEKSKALNTMEDCSNATFNELSADVSGLNLQIADATQRIREYQRQQDSAN